MPEFRYAVPGVPDGQAGMTAFAPVFPGYAASGRQAYKYDVTQYLGMVAVPAPTQGVQFTAHTDAPRDLSDLAQMGYSRSQDAPDAWYPGKGYQGRIAERPGAGMAIRIYDPVHPGPTTVLPVPATALAGGQRRDSSLQARPALVQRIRQLPWFPRMQNFPDWGRGGRTYRGAD